MLSSPKKITTAIPQIFINFLCLLALFIFAIGAACSLGATGTSSPPTTVPSAPPTQANLDETFIPTESVPTEVVIPPTPIGIQNPTGLIPAQETIYVDGLTLIVEDRFEAENDIIYGDLITIYLIVQNMSTRQKLFSYTNGSVRLLDDLGNEYAFVLSTNEQHLIYDIKQQTLDPNETLSIFSFDSTSAGTISRLPYYRGPIFPGASRLIIEFNGFGPFSGFSCFIEL